jgi:hypothetical protein
VRRSEIGASVPAAAVAAVDELEFYGMDDRVSDT